MKKKYSESCTKEKEISNFEPIYDVFHFSLLRGSQNNQNRNDENLSLANRRVLYVADGCTPMSITCKFISLSTAL